MLEISNATVSDGSLKNVSLRIQQRDIHMIAALDTEVLEGVYRILSLKEKPVSGEITLNGKPYASSAVRYISADTGNVVRELTVAQNVIGLVRRPCGIYRRKAVEKQCQELIDQFAFPIKAHMMLRSMDTEGLRLVELLRCYVQKPDVLVLNELLNVFSVRNIVRVKELLTAMSLQGTHVIYLTRKAEDVFNLGDAITVLRQGQVAGSFRKEEILQRPDRFYRMLLGEDNIFSDEQMAVSNTSFDVLDIIRIGRQCIFAQESVGNTLCKYAHLTERYFGDVRCVIYLINSDSNRSFSRYFAFEHQWDEMPITGENTLRQILRQKDMIAIMPWESSIHTQAKGFENGTFLYAKIQSGDEDAGLLQVAFPEHYTPVKKDMEYLGVATGEIAVLFNNTRLIGRSALMQEGHHRIKNNLQLVTSMLMLYKAKYRNSGRDVFTLGEVEELIDTTVKRVKGIAAIHDLLSKPAILNDLISFRSVLDEIRRFYEDEIHVEVNYDAVPVLSHARATSFALVLNELISNSVKHNQGKPDLKCRMEIAAHDGRIILEYRDNGAGFPPDSSQSKTGIGSLLIRSIVQAELNGTMENFNDGGACTRIGFDVTRTI